MTCHNCRIECAKSGKRPDGLQRYRCSQCGKTFSDHKDFGVIGHKQADEEASLLALHLIVEGNSIRSASRISGLDKKTIMKLVVMAGGRCEALMATRVKSVPVSDVQCDEIWSFVGKKEGHKHHGDGPYLGNAWCFIAIERNTKFVLAYQLGKRTVTSASKFITKLATATDPTHRFQLTTDGLNAYAYSIGTILDERADYAQLVKIYKQDTAEEQRRYSPSVNTQNRP